MPLDVPKQPQSIFKPLKRLIEIAIIKIPSKAEIMKAFSFTLIPKIKRMPVVTSIQGKVRAAIFVSEKGSSL